MAKTARDIINSDRFKALVRKRWSVSIVLTILLFVLYYGYILLVAYNKPLLAVKVGQAATLGIVLGVLTIVGSWALTVAYVLWANTVYDREVDAIKRELV
jgi:uncharacterized membrane protein (DUF485 family)